MSNNSGINPVLTARVAGLLYLLIALFGVVSTLFGPESLLVPGDVTATANNIASSELLYRLAFMGDLTGQVIFIFLVLFLYKLLKPVDKNLAVVMVALVLVGIPIAMLNILNQIAALLVVSSADILAVFNIDQAYAHVILFLDLYQNGLRIAFIFWGLWLFPLGYLVYKSGFLPKILGILLLIAGFGYLFETVTYFLVPSLNVSIKIFTFWGEVLLALWLLIKGVNVEMWEKCADETT